MSNRKPDKGKLFHKLHQLQKIVTRFLKTGNFDQVKHLELRERKLLERIRGKRGKKE